MEPNCCEPVRHIFCEKCQLSLEEPCWTHATRFYDKYVVPYAVASLPEQLYLDVSAKQPEKAVFAKEFLPSHSVFGPLAAPLSESGKQFCYAVRSESDQKLRYFQLESDLSSNWMKHVRFAHEPFEQNVAVYSVGMQLFFVTTVDIFPGEELKVGYSLRYTKLMGISYAEGLRAPDGHSPVISVSSSPPVEQSLSDNDLCARHEEVALENHSDDSDQSMSLSMGDVCHIEDVGTNHQLPSPTREVDISSEQSLAWTKQRLRSRDAIRKAACTFPADIAKPKKPKETRKRQRCRLCRGKYRYVDIEKHFDERHPEHVKRVAKKNSAKESSAHVETEIDSAPAGVMECFPTDFRSLIGNAYFQAQPVFTLVPTELHPNAMRTLDEPGSPCTSGHEITGSALGILAQTDREVHVPSSSEPQSKTFEVNNWQVSRITPEPNLHPAVSPDATEGRISAECGSTKRRKLPHSAGYTDNSPGMAPQLTQPAEETQVAKRELLSRQLV